MSSLPLDTPIDNFSLIPIPFLIIIFINVIRKVSHQQQRSTGNMNNKYGVGTREIDEHQQKQQQEEESTEYTL